MKHFVLVCVDPRRPVEREPLRARAVEGLRLLGVRGLTVWQDDSILLVHQHTEGEDVQHGEDGRLVLAHGQTRMGADGSLRAPVADGAPGWLEPAPGIAPDLVCPFALLGRRAAGDAVRAVADPAGLVHLFGWQGEGIAAVSTSSLLLGRMWRLPLDWSAIGQFGLVGHYLGASSAFAGVGKLRPGHVFELERGRIREVAQPAAFEGTLASSSAEQGADTLRSIVTAHCETYQGCDLELSGGIDSRMVLAAIPRTLRPRHAAVTLGAPDSQDVRIAARLARASGMRHRVIDTRALGELSFEHLVDLLDRASLRHDHAANPLDKAAIEMSRELLGDTPRLSGQNGELVRGFYYPGQRLGGSVDAGHVDRLVAWRVIGNDAARRDLFERSLHDGMRRGVCDAVKACVGQSQGEWGRALDHLYLSQRMQRWCGAAVSAACTERVILLPFFDHRFIAWALAAAPSRKRGSRLACELIDALDPALSLEPLDSGRAPRTLARGGVTSLAGKLTTGLSKGVRKAWQKASGRRPSNLGTRSAMSTVSRRVEALVDWERLAEVPLLDRGTLRRLREGSIPADRATLGFLIALDRTIAFVDAA